MIKTFILTFQKHSKSTPDPIPHSSARLHHTQALVHVKEYARIICTLAPSTHVAPSNETIGVLCLLHPLAKVDFPPFIDDFHLETKDTLYQEAFVYVLVCSLHISFGGVSHMVYELL
jgi:hypothetical protein